MNTALPAAIWNGPDINLPLRHYAYCIDGQWMGASSVQPGKVAEASNDGTHGHVTIKAGDLVRFDHGRSDRAYEKFPGDNDYEFKNGRLRPLGKNAQIVQSSEQIKSMNFVHISKEDHVKLSSSTAERQAAEIATYFNEFLKASEKKHRDNLDYQASLGGSRKVSELYWYGPELSVDVFAAHSHAAMPAWAKEIGMEDGSAFAIGKISIKSGDPVEYINSSGKTYGEFEVAPVLGREVLGKNAVIRVSGVGMRDFLELRSTTVGGHNADAERQMLRLETCVRDLLERHHENEEKAKSVNPSCATSMQRRP